MFNSLTQYRAPYSSLTKTPRKVDVLNANLAWHRHEIHIQHRRRSGKFEVSPPDPTVTKHGTNPISRRLQGTECNTLTGYRHRVRVKYV